MQSVVHGIQGTRRARAVADSLAPSGWELLSLILLAVFYWGGGALLGQDNSQILNLFGPLVLGAVLALGALRMARIDTYAIWTAPFWFRIATALYFGLGSIIPNFVNAETLLYMQGYFAPSPGQILTLNLVTALSCFAVLTSSWIAAKIWKRTRYRALISIDSPMLPIAGLGFAVIGAAVEYLVLLPYALGVWGDAPLPGVVVYMKLLAPVALYMLTLWSIRHRPSLLPIMVFFLASQILVGFIEFNKSDIILPLLLFILAFLSQKISIPRLVIAAASIVFVFNTIVPLTDFGRDELSRRYHSILSASLDERLDILENHYSEGIVSNTGNDIQRSLARICYVYASTFAIASYDSGSPGSTLDDAFAVFVPRILWPDKPIISDIAVQYNKLATGNASSASGPGLMAEAYWDFGWFGVPILMVPLGVILLLLGRYSMWILNTGRWGYFPLVLFAMRIGLRIDGFFVLDVIGPIAILVVLHMMAYGVELVWTAHKARRAVQ